MPVATSVRLPAMLAAAALALAACATDTDAEQTADAAGQDLDTTVEETTEPTPTEVTVTTAQGDVTVPFQPQRVVVVEHGILDTIDYLGAGESVVGIPHHAVPSYLADYTTSTANTGTLFEPDYEAINAAEPDLIIVGGRSAATLPEMEDIAPTIDLSFGWGSEAFMTSFESNTTALGQIFGAEDEAAAAPARSLPTGPPRRAASTSSTTSWAWSPRWTRSRSTTTAMPSPSSSSPRWTRRC